MGLPRQNHLAWKGTCRWTVLDPADRDLSSHHLRISCTHLGLDGTATSDAIQITTLVGRCCNSSVHLLRYILFCPVLDQVQGKRRVTGPSGMHFINVLESHRFNTTPTTKPPPRVSLVYRFSFHRSNMVTIALSFRNTDAKRSTGSQE